MAKTPGGLNKTKDGVKIFGSARDFGNAGAGYVAGIWGVTWEKAQKEFNDLEKKTSGRDEGQQSTLAQKIGWNEGSQKFFDKSVGDAGPMGHVFVEFWGKLIETLKFW